MEKSQVSEQLIFPEFLKINKIILLSLKFEGISVSKKLMNNVPNKLL